MAHSSDRALRYKQRLGIILCIIYAVVYSGFVVISIYDVTLMDTLMPFGLNLSTFYGLGLIVFALILAMLYSMACSSSENKFPPSENETQTHAAAEKGKQL